MDFLPCKYQLQLSGESDPDWEEEEPAQLKFKDDFSKGQDRLFPIGQEVASLPYK